MINLHFTRAQFFASHSQLQMLHSSVNSIVNYRTGGVTGETSIVYDLYFLTARSTVHGKFDSFGILPYLNNLWYNIIRC